MLQLLREQEEERRLSAAGLAESLLRSCGSADGGGRAKEKAQATVHEALRCAKANSGNRSSNRGPTGPLEDGFLDTGTFFYALINVVEPSLMQKIISDVVAGASIGKLSSEQQTKQSTV